MRRTAEAPVAAATIFYLNIRSMEGITPNNAMKTAR
jgi:hypothetical protein